MTVPMFQMPMLIPETIPGCHCALISLTVSTVYAILTAFLLKHQALISIKSSVLNNLCFDSVYRGHAEEAVGGDGFRRRF